MTQTPALPRARGRLHVVAKRRGAASVIGDLHQSGSMKALFPRARGDALDVVFLNTAGGMTGGDIFDIRAEAGEEARLILTSQAAERIYGAVDHDPAQLSTRLAVGSGARIDWLPQETIFFNNSMLQRKLTVDLAPDARFLMVEPLVFGRQTMGETVEQGWFADDVRISRGDDLIFADAVRLDGNIHEALQGIGTGQKSMAIASVLYVGPDAEAHLTTVRDLLPETGGASLIRDGVLFARVMAPDSYLLRQTLCPVMAHLHGAALPKTWTL